MVAAEAATTAPAGGGGEEEEVAAAGPPTPAGAADLRRVAAHVDALITHSYSGTSFPGKWQSIRGRLAKLSSALATATTGVSPSGASDVSSLSALLGAITSTVDEAFSLSCACAGEPYAGGKLLLRSNLDLVASKLDLHARSLDQIYASGALAHARAIVLSKPGAGASRDDMRAYVRDLFSRLKLLGGDPELASRTLAALNEALREDDKYARIAGVETPDAAGVLVDLLESGDGVLQEGASAAVSTIAEFDSYRPPLVLAGAVAALVRVLETGSALGKEKSAMALRSLTDNADNAWSVSAHGGVTVLLKICSGDSNGSELVGSACGVLRNLTGVGEVRRFMVDQGAVPVFVGLAKSTEEASAIQAMEFLQAIAGDDVDMKARVVREGGAESLVGMLDPASPLSSKAREVAFRAAEALCFSPASSVSTLLGAGFLDRVGFFLRHGETSAQEAALKAASRLCAASVEAQRAVGDAGLVPELVRLAGEARSSEAREVAAEALARVLAVRRNRRKFVEEGGELGVGRILQLLDPQEEKKVNRRFLLAALTVISESSSGRRKISASGHVKNLEKLAERDVAEAKRIVKKLSYNRFFSILSGFWGS